MLASHSHDPTVSLQQLLLPQVAPSVVHDRRERIDRFRGSFSSELLHVSEHFWPPSWIAACALLKGSSFTWHLAVPECSEHVGMVSKTHNVKRSIRWPNNQNFQGGSQRPTLFRCYVPVTELFRVTPDVRCYVTFPSILEDGTERNTSPEQHFPGSL